MTQASAPVGGLGSVLSGIEIVEAGGLVSAICGAHFARCGARVTALRSKDQSMGSWDHGKRIVRVDEGAAAARDLPAKADYVVVEPRALGAAGDPGIERRTTLHIELLPKATLLNGALSYSEAILQGLSGIWQYVGTPSEPQLLDTPVVSISAGMLAFNAGLMCEFQPYRSVTVSVLGVMAYLMSPLFAAEDYGATWGGHHVMGKFDPVNVGWQTRDGSVYFIFGKADGLRQFAADLDLARVLALDPKAALGTVGTGHLAPAYHADYERAFARYTTAELMTKIQARGGWVTPILAYEDVIGGEQVKATGGYVEADGVKLPSLPYRFIE